ncbi:S41 family peptidase [Streptomyces sp. NPDC088354]|uniref:S41 family peptidase n=1 Tax=Streptomyces sp. NPDC088354 TaxID=3365856 RepID=UPI003813BFC5
MSPQARAYLDHALSLLQQYSIASEHTDWADLRQWTYSLAQGAQTADDTHRAIDDAARYLNKHSELDPPEMVSASQAVPAAKVPVPTGRVVSGRVGLVVLPERLFGRSTADRRYVQAARAAVRRLDRAGVCGWIVDLRGNRGGSMDPMIAAVAPLFGNGRLGRFVAPNGDAYHSWSWAIRGGQLHREFPGSSQAETFGTSPYELSRPVPPVAVLTDNSTASAGEATAISFRGRPYTRSFGSPTAGVPSGNITFTLSDGAHLAITSVAEADRTGHRYDPDTPLAPDQLTQPEEAEAAATAWLQQQPPCASPDGRR